MNSMSVRAVRLRPARPHDRAQVVDVIDAVAGERCYLQTERYVPTPAWERVLREGTNVRQGLLLLVIENEQQIFGFARLTRACVDPMRRACGEIGIALLPPFRSQGLGTMMLGQVLAYAPALAFRTLTADILADNFISLRLFAKHKFAPKHIQEIVLPFGNAPTRQVTVELNL